MTETEWLKCGNPILQFEHDRGWPSPRKQRLFATACCRRIGHLLTDERWWNGISVAELYADRRTARPALIDAGVKADIGRPARATYADILREQCGLAVQWACHTKHRRYAAISAVHGASAAGYSAMPPAEPFVPPAYSRHHAQWSATERAESAAQLALLFDVCNDPFRPPAAFSSAWRTDTAVALARQMYESREFGAMPILADALQDAGCDSADILDHCRGPDPHVRGCWVVDLVLGKE